MSTSSLVIPEDLPQEVVKWSNANVQNSLEANKAEYYIEDDDIKILEQKNVTGRILLGLTSKRLENYGLVKGAADLIVMIVEQLKVIKELGESDIVAPLALESLTFSNLCLFVPTTEAGGTTVGAQKRLAKDDLHASINDSKYEALRQDLVLKIQDTNKITYQDTLNNKIRQQVLLGSRLFYTQDNLVAESEEMPTETQGVSEVPHLTQDTSQGTTSGVPSVLHVPKHVKDYHDRLVARLPSNNDERVTRYISELRHHLGDAELQNHIELAADGLPVLYFEILNSALSNFSRKRTALNPDIAAQASEAWLTAIVVDRLLVDLKSYFRDKSHATIVIENSSGRTPWKPRNDFGVSFLSGFSGYALLHGETMSAGELPDDASYKTAVMSVHSLKMLKFYTGRNDQVILTVHVSYATCTMHLLFYDEKKGYVQLCVFYGSRIFEPEHQSLLMEFVRRICNFARFARPEGPEELSDPNYQEKVDLVQSIFDDFQTEKAKYSHQSRRKGNQGDHRTSRAGEQDMTRLTQKGFNMIQIPYEMYQSDKVVLLRESSSDQVLIAKRTTAVEVKLIKSLLSARSNKYENHTIAYKHVLQFSDVHAYLIMPYYSDLSSIKFLSSQLYLCLRPQLIEGVAFMHEQGVVHRDLKPSNIVVEFKEYRLFIIDYDLSQHQSPGGQCFGYRGTEGWTAPEIQPDAVWDPWSADIWALANVLRYLAKRTGYSDPIADRVLTLRPAERPSAGKLLELYSRSSKRGLTSQEGLPFPKRPRMTPHLGDNDPDP